jgi:hypothetical protein
MIRLFITVGSSLTLVGFTNTLNARLPWWLHSKDLSGPRLEEASETAIAQVTTGVTMGLSSHLSFQPQLIHSIETVSTQ